MRQYGKIFQRALRAIRDQPLTPRRRRRFLLSPQGLHEGLRGNSSVDDIKTSLPPGRWREHHKTRMLELKFHAQEQLSRGSRLAEEMIEYQIISVPNVCIGKARCPIHVRIVRIQCHFLQATQVRIFIGNIKVWISGSSKLFSLWW